MNIIVQNSEGVISCRPDTTRDREGRNLFAPDFVTGYSYAPVLFAHLCKVGKLVAPKFATRYYDTVNYGVLLYPGTPHGLTAVMDRTSFLPQPMADRAVLESGTNVFELLHNGEPLFKTTTAGGLGLIEEAIMNASRYLLLRTGDIVVAELAPIAPLPHTEADDPALDAGPKHRLSASFCGRGLFDFCIK